MSNIKQQVLLCPVCGKSGTIDNYSIDVYGNPEPDPSRKRYKPYIKLRHQLPDTGRMTWTTHEVPLRVLVALRQQLVEALVLVDELIAEGNDA